MKPSFVKGLDHVNASYVSPYGTIKSYWKKENEQLKWDVQIPGNTTALVYVPAASVEQVKERSADVLKSNGVRFVKMENGCAVFEVGSGYYSFSTQHKLVYAN